MNEFLKHVDSEYGFFGFVCVGLTLIIAFLIWFALSILLILPAFVPVAFVAWWAYKYYKDRS